MAQKPSTSSSMGNAQVHTKYNFQHNGIVTIAHHYGGNLRVLPIDLAMGDGNGRDGKFAQWKVCLQNQYRSCCKIQNEYTGKYLRIYNNNGTFSIDTTGNGGLYTLFNIHFINENVIKLESSYFNGKYIAFTTNKTLQIDNGDLSNCLLTFWCVNNGSDVFNNNKPKLGFVQPRSQSAIVVKAQSRLNIQNRYSYQQRVAAASPYNNNNNNNNNNDTINNEDDDYNYESKSNIDNDDDEVAAPLYSNSFVTFNEPNNKDNAVISNGNGQRQTTMAVIANNRFLGGILPTTPNTRVHVINSSLQPSFSREERDNIRQWNEMRRYVNARLRIQQYYN